MPGQLFVDYYNPKHPERQLHPERLKITRLQRCDHRSLSLRIAFSGSALPLDGEISEWVQPYADIQLVEHDGLVAREVRLTVDQNKHRPSQQ